VFLGVRGRSASTARQPPTANWTAGPRPTNCRCTPKCCAGAPTCPRSCTPTPRTWSWLAGLSLLADRTMQQTRSALAPWGRTDELRTTTSSCSPLISLTR
jgi:hypothetical protein